MNTENFSEVISEIYETRKERSINDIDTRVMKLCEEAGEAIGALLSIRSNSYKGLTYDDLREELVDAWIVVTDALLTPMPIDKDNNQDTINENVTKIMHKKIEKWRKNAKKG